MQGDTRKPIPIIEEPKFYHGKRFIPGDVGTLHAELRIVWDHQIDIEIKATCSAVGLGKKAKNKMLDDLAERAKAVAEEIVAGVLASREE